MILFLRTIENILIIKIVYYKKKNFLNDNDILVFKKLNLIYFI